MEAVIIRAFFARINFTGVSPLRRLTKARIKVKLKAVL